MSYLKATNLILGLLINFNVKLLKEGITRIINSNAIEEDTNRQDAKAAKKESGKE